MLSTLKGSMTIVVVTHRDALLTIADKVVRLKPQHASEGTK
jgi:ABC-type lipoprotein export system ATPase subunit